MKALYSNALIPPEWIAAHGLSPCRLPARPAPEPPPAGACPFAWTWLHAALEEPEAACLILATECDMMRRLAETAAQRTSLPVFLFNMPKVVGSPVARKIYRSELLRLGRFLIGCGGHHPAPNGLADLLRIHAERRNDPEHPALSGVPLALAGGPLMPQHTAILDLIQQAGGAVVLDATETGEIALPPPPDPALLAADPLGALVQIYYDGIPSVHHRPNTALYHWLDPRLLARGVRGVLFFHYAWCDAWHAESRRMQQRVSLPCLPIVLSADGPLNHHVATRIEAFLETVR